MWTLLCQNLSHLNCHSKSIPSSKEVLPLNWSVQNPIFYGNHSDNEHFIHFGQLFWLMIRHRKVRQLSMHKGGTWSYRCRVSRQVSWKSSCSLKWDWIIYGYKLEGQKPFLIHHSFPWSDATAKTRRMEQSLAHKPSSRYTSEYFHTLRTNPTFISVRNIHNR